MGALALACFAKVVGVIYLGTPRDSSVPAAREPAPGMTLPPVGLAALCLTIGLLPIAVVPPALRVGALVAGGSTGGAQLPTAAATVFAGVLAAGVLGAWLLHRTFSRRRVPLEAATWGCGFATTTPRMAYTASSFAAPLLAPFGSFAGTRTDRTGEAFATHAFDPVLDRVMLPAWRGVRAAATRLRPIQRGRLSLYLLYVGAAVIIVLLYLFSAGKDL
jgi:NADH:ubiquinone oxidoreductase subunit 5 (subunit L)/multisubunit Na+/H+ antiporter MnhA subunit